MHSFKLLQEKYNKLQKKGFIKSVNKYSNGAGLTLESELESTGGDFNIPDFLDIEIKSFYQYRKTYIELFNSAPDGKHFPGSIWLAENFGYPDKDYPNIKVLKGNVYGNRKRYIGYKYQYKLNVNYFKKKIILEIYKNEHMINDEIYWDFDTLKEKLLRKDSKMAIFKFIKKNIEGNVYYKYNSLYMYKLRCFEIFIKLIENGTIFITFKIGVHKSGKYMGKISDHGTGFKIYFGDMKELFYKVN